jgi:DNA polymerase-1
MKLLVLDGNSILNRAYYGIKLLTAKDGTFTNGIYGFLTILNKIRTEASPDAVAVAFDMKAPTFRHREYAGYKANRKGMPEELASQMPILKELLAYLGYNIVTCEGYEADDILGTFSKSCAGRGDQCLIATGDRDSLQLVSDTTTVRLASTKFGQSVVTLYDEARIKEEYGVTPHQMIDIKAIQGDSSDNIPGAKGIGEKGARELIAKYGTVENIYSKLDTLDIRPRTKQLLTESRDSVMLSYRLGTICCDAPIDSEPEHYIMKEADIKSASALMSRLELFSLMEKMGINSANIIHGKTSEKNRPEYKIKELSDAAAVLAAAEDEGKAFFLTEYGQDGKIIRMYFNEGNTVYIVKPDSVFLRALTTASSFNIVTYDIKSFYKAAISDGCGEIRAATDIMLAAYLLNATAASYDMDKLLLEYSVTPGENENTYVSQVMALPELSEKIGAEIEKNSQSKLLNDIEMPLAYVLARMELVGFMVNRSGIEEFGEEIGRKADSLNETIMEEVGYEFNVNSPKQLGEALFEKMGLKHGKKTKNGYSTSADVLESLRYDNPVVDEILTYRTLTKLKSTYCDGMVKVIGEDRRIHSSFNQTETRTGRISSTEPNLQNIPVRTELGREMRKFFIAREGCTLVDADYSQIELRVLAHVADDKVMTELFKNGEDIHRATAARVFNIPEEMVTPGMRSSAKAVNFGIVYGIGAFSLSKNIGVSRREAEDYINEYLREFSGVRDYMEESIKKAREKGYAEDIFGRRRYLPELASSNFNLRSFGERVARNMPIQGAAADIIKKAMIKVERRLLEEKLDARLILQVHDELIVECPKSESEKVSSILKEEMENAVSMRVPLVADAHIGDTWYDAKG